MAHKNTFYKKHCVGSITLPIRLIFCQNKDKTLVYLYRKNCNVSSSVGGYSGDWSVDIIGKYFPE